MNCSKYRCRRQQSSFIYLKQMPEKNQVIRIGVVGGGKQYDPKITLWTLGIMLIQHWATLWKHLFCIRPVFLPANGNWWPTSLAERGLVPAAWSSLSSGIFQVQHSSWGDFFAVWFLKLYMFVRPALVRNLRVVNKYKDPETIWQHMCAHHSATMALTLLVACGSLKVAPQHQANTEFPFPVSCWCKLAVG